MKAVQLVFNALLPPDLRRPDHSFDAKSLGKLLATVAEKHPDKYAEVAKGIADLGRKASYLQGETLTLSDLRPTFDRDAVLGQMNAEVAKARQLSKSDEEFEQARERVWSRYSDLLEKTTAETALAVGNNLAHNVVSGARGKAPQLKAMLSTPGLYSDFNDKTIPIFVQHSFSEGLRPAEFIAGSFGARKSVLSTKRSTADGGDLAKQLSQIAANLTITSKDCGTTNGVDLDPDDASLRGRVLAREVAGIPAGTVIDRHVLAKLRGAKGKLLVRSAMTCSAEHGLCAKCAGARMNGQLPRIGESIGVAASQAVSEPITQGALNQKHTGGAVSGGKKTYAGFDVINQIVQTPEVFPDKAEVAQVDGKVSKIEPAAQGGFHVFVDGEEHYVPAGYPLTVKVGDRLEAGEPLSEGIVDVSDVVKLRGLGEGRRYYATRLKQALDDSGLNANLRNTEILARAAIDHVIVDDAEGIGEFLPDDIVSYNRIQQVSPPARSTRRAPVSAQLAGKYLQQPALHYTIGTRLTPKMTQHLATAGFDEVQVADEPPKFYPEMQRLRSAAHSNPDWMARLSTSYLKSNLQDSAVRGADTNIAENNHWAPRLAVGTGFGAKAHETGKF